MSHTRLDVALADVVEGVLMIDPVGSAGIALLDHDGRLVVHAEAVAAGWLPAGEPMAGGDWPIDPAELGEGRPHLITAASPALTPGEDALLRHHAAGAILTLPLCASDAPLGVIQVRARAVDAFSPTDVDRWLDIARQTAITIQTIRSSAVASREAERQSILRQASDIIARTTDRWTAFHQVSELGLQLPGVDSCRIQLWDETTGLIEVGFEVTIPKWPGVAEAGTLLTPAEAWPFPRLLEERQPIHHWIGDPLTPAEGTGYLAEAGIGCLLECPMLADGRLLGSLGFHARDRAPFSHTTRELAVELATQTALVVRELMVREISARVSDERAMLLRVSIAANSSLDLHVVLREVVEATIGVAGAERCKIDLLDAARGEYEVGALATIDDWPLSDEPTVGASYPVGGWSIDAMVATSRHPLVVNSLADPYVNGKMASDMGRIGAASIVMCPLWADDRYIGALSVLSRQPGAFRSDGVTLMRAVAQQATVAIQNARRLAEERTRADQQTALLRVSRAATSSLDLYPVLQEVCAACLGIDGAESAEVQLYDPRKDEFEVAALACNPGCEHTVALGARFAAGYWAHIDPLITGQRQPIIVVGTDDPLVCAELRRKMTTDRIESLLVIPLWHVDTCHGALVLFSGMTASFAPEHLSLADQIAQHATVAIQNARLLENERRGALERSLFLEITAAASGDGTLPELLTLIAKAGLAVPGAESCQIDLYDAGRRELEIGALVSIADWPVGASAGTGSRCPLDDWGLDAEVVVSSTPVVLHDTDDPRLDATMRADFATQGTRSAVLYPLRAHGQCLGIFNLFSRQPHVFGEPELAVAGELAARAGAAIQHALATERERRLAAHRGTLLRINSAATSVLNLSAMLGQVAAELKAATGVPAMIIELWHPDEDAFEVALSLNEPGLVRPPAVGARFPRGAFDVFEQILSGTIPFAVDLRPTGPAHPDRDRLAARGAATMVCTPLWANAQCLGVVTLYDPRPNLLDEGMRELLEEASGHIALAIANARLIESERRRSLERSVLLEVGGAATADLPLADKLRRMAEACLALPEVEGATITSFFPERGVAVTVVDVAIDDWPGVDEPGTTYDLHDMRWLEDWLVHGRPRIDDIDDPACPAERLAEIRGFGGQASLWVGLRLAGETFGGLALHTRQRGALNDATIAIATEIAAQISLTIRNARLHTANVDLLERQRQRADDRATLLQISRAVATSGDLAADLSAAAESLRIGTGFDVVEVERWRPELDLFEVAGTSTGSAPGLGDPIGARTRRVDFAIYDQVLANAGAISLRLSDLPVDSPERGALQRYELETAILAPLAANDQTFGLLALYARGDVPITDRVVRLAEEAAGHIALAMANADLLEQERRQALEHTVMVKVGQAAIAVTNLDDKLLQIANLCLELPEVEGVTIEYWYPSRMLVEIVADVTVPDWGDPDPVGKRYEIAPEDWIVDWRPGAGSCLYDTADPMLNPRIRGDLLSYGATTSLWDGIELDDDVSLLVGFHSRASGVFTVETTRFAATIAAQTGLAIRNARLLAETQRHANEQAALLRVSRAVTTVTPESLADSLQQIAALSMNVVDADLCEIMIWHRDLDATELVAQVYSPSWTGDREPMNVLLPLAERTVALAVLHERRAVIMHPDPSLYSPSEHQRIWADGTQSGLAAPLVFGERAIGLIGYFAARPNAFDDHHASLAVDLGAQTALAIERATTLAALAEQATTDGLTGLLNHRAIRDRLDDELLLAQRREVPVAVFMVDLDRFKQINDTHGHLIGDLVIQHAAAALKTATRQTDIVGRYGGDEFLVILPATDAVEAVVVADRILADAAKTMIQLPNGDLLAPSLSIGFAIYPTDAESRPELVEIADRAMYDAKARTRHPISHGTHPLRLVPAAGSGPRPPRYGTSTR